jgi:hypothetical protein
VHDVTISGFHVGVVAFDKLQLDDSTVSENFSLGVAGTKLTIVGTTVTNNGTFGVDGWTDRGYGVRLIDSTVTGNGTHFLCATNPCADVGSLKPPRLLNTTCDTSYVVGSDDPANWGVCALD